MLTLHKHTGGVGDSALLAGCVARVGARAGAFHGGDAQRPVPHLRWHQLWHGHQGTATWPGWWQQGGATTVGMGAWSTHPTEGQPVVFCPHLHRVPALDRKVTPLPGDNRLGVADSPAGEAQCSLVPHLYKCRGGLQEGGRCWKANPDPNLNSQLRAVSTQCRSPVFPVPALGQVGRAGEGGMGQYR